MNISKIREDFPILQQPIIYFDNACMALKPRQVVEALERYYYEFPSCHGRSSHRLGRKLNDEIEASRKVIQRFFGSKGEVVFTRNTTEAINLVASSFPFKKGDTVITTDKEHNSNLVPWIRLAQEKGIVHKIAASDERGLFSLDSFESLLKKAGKEGASHKSILVSMVHTSNLDGTTLPAKEICKISHEYGAVVLLDGAQSAPHKEINLKKIDADFFALSGHKMMGPTGIGCLIGKPEALEKLSQFIVGGETVTNSTYEGYTPERIPNRFEAGLQHYAGIIGMAEACRYIEAIGRSDIEKHDLELNGIITHGLRDSVDILGPEDPAKRGSIFSFWIRGMESHAAGLMLDARNIMVRSGMHCCHSWFNARKKEGSVRASLYIHNTAEECHRFINEIKRIKRIAG